MTSTAAEDSKQAASERARELRMRRLKKSRGFGLAGALLILAFFAPSIAMWLVIIAALVAGFSGFEAWMGRRHNDQIRQRRAAAREERAS